MITVQIFKIPKCCILHNYSDTADFIDSSKTFGSQCVAYFQLLRQVPLRICIDRSLVLRLLIS